MLGFVSFSKNYWELVFHKISVFENLNSTSEFFRIRPQTCKDITPAVLLGFLEDLWGTTINAGKPIKRPLKYVLCVLSISFYHETATENILSTQKKQPAWHFKLTSITRTFIIKYFFSSLEGFQCWITTDTPLTTHIFSLCCAVHLNKHAFHHQSAVCNLKLTSCLETMTGHWYATRTSSKNVTIHKWMISSTSILA